MSPLRRAVRPLLGRWRDCRPAAGRVLRRLDDIPRRLFFSVTALADPWRTVALLIAEFADLARRAVVRISDKRWGEVGQAFVIARAGTLLHPDTLRSRCRDRLARYKVPAAIRVVDEMPRTAPCKAEQQRLGRAPR